MIAEIPLTCVSNCSRIYESEPAYETRQDAFANAVIEIKTELAPLVLLDELMKIEVELGRDRSKKAKANGPRTIDLDLLWMDGEIHGGEKTAPAASAHWRARLCAGAARGPDARPGAVLPLQRRRGQGARLFRPSRIRVEGVVAMAQKAYSLSHTKWMCKYHIVFTPKYRRKRSTAKSGAT